LKLFERVGVAIVGLVETLRKPSTGLKRVDEAAESLFSLGRDTQKTQHGIETRRLAPDVVGHPRRDTQKTQHGIETAREGRLCIDAVVSRHSENPARD